MSQLFRVGDKVQLSRSQAHTYCNIPVGDVHIVSACHDGNRMSFRDLFGVYPMSAFRLVERAFDPKVDPWYILTSTKEEVAQVHGWAQSLGLRAGSLLPSYVVNMVLFNGSFYVDYQTEVNAKEASRRLTLTSETTYKYHIVAEETPKQKEIKAIRAEMEKLSTRLKALEGEK